METKVFSYTADLEWRGGRRAEVSSDGCDPITITPPPDFPGGSGSDWSPEHLFLASIESCTMLSFIAHCSHNGIEVVSYESSVEGRLSRREDDRRYAFASVDMTVLARVSGGHAQAARGLTDKAERDCFISASTTASVHTDWRIIE
ncbi:MAG: OsmC family protein [Gaiellales bacterium]